MPELLFHGHMHVADERELPDGRRVVSLGRDDQDRNLGLLDVHDLTWTWLPSMKVARRPRSRGKAEGHIAPVSD
ncbi:MAG TPA: hypothetical protein VEX88_14220 [Glaciibacter sp.]|nr:hypothetical protein [Glaciibacter sp.]